MGWRCREPLLDPPAIAERESVLLEVQVTTHSTMGTVAYETGGILIDFGWLRFLGSGHPRLTRTLSSWNRDRSNGFYLIADDAAGGFFAVNGGAFGDDRGNVYYWSPDSLEWEGLQNSAIPISFVGRSQTSWLTSTPISVGRHGKRMS